MDGAELFEVCLLQATAVVKQVRPDHFANATPDSDWNVRDLLGHMLYELSLVPDMVEGKTLDDIDKKFEDDLVGDNDIELSMNWQDAADSAELAVRDIDPDETAHTKAGDITIDEYLNVVASDLLIHAWDLGKAIGVPVQFDVDAASAVNDFTVPRQQQLLDSGLIAAEVEVVGQADLQTRLLALYGRRADWRAPTPVLH